MNDYHLTSSVRGEIKETVLSVLRFADIHTLPVNLSVILRAYQIRSLPLSAACEAGLNIQCRDGRTICQYRSEGMQYLILYNDSHNEARMRWTIAHELGHIMLDHVTQNDTVLERMEAEANYFALQLLAPLAVLDAMDAKSASEIQALCGLSHQAAELRRRDFERRNRHKAKHGDTKHDLLFLQQFAIVSQDPVI